MLSTPYLLLTTDGIHTDRPGGLRKTCPPQIRQTSSEARSHGRHMDLHGNVQHPWRRHISPPAVGATPAGRICGS